MRVDYFSTKVQSTIGNFPPLVGAAHINSCQVTEGRCVRPHPGPLPLGEGESQPVSRRITRL